MRYIDNGNGAGAWIHSDRAAKYYIDVIHRDYPGMPVNISEEVEDLEVLAHHEYTDEDGRFTEMFIVEFLCDQGHIHVTGFLAGEELPPGLSREGAFKWFELAKEADPAHPNHAKYKEDNDFLTILQMVDPGVDISSIVDKMIEERL